MEKASIASCDWLSFSFFLLDLKLWFCFFVFSSSPCPFSLRWGSFFFGHVRCEWGFCSVDLCFLWPTRVFDPTRLTHNRGLGRVGLLTKKWLDPTQPMTLPLVQFHLHPNPWSALTIAMRHFFSLYFFYHVIHFFDFLLFFVMPFIVIVGNDKLALSCLSLSLIGNNEPPSSVLLLSHFLDQRWQPSFTDTTLPSSCVLHEFLRHTIVSYLRN